MNPYKLEDDIIGKKFGRLLCLKFSGYRVTPSGNRRKMFLFKCDCGKEKEICGSMVKRGKVQSCICMSGEHFKINKKLGKDNSSYRHGFFGTKFYDVYSSMRRRTTHKFRFYKHVDCLWNSFNEFKDDMYDSFLDHVEKFGERQTTIDRIDSKGHYCKENCRWATYKEQANNRKNNLKIEIDGQIKNLNEWVTILNLSRYAIVKKLKSGKLGRVIH